MEKNLSCGEISSHERCGDKSVLSQFLLFCREICFIAIFAVLLRKIFCRDLRAFVWRKIKPKNCACGEKWTNIRYVGVLGLVGLVGLVGVVDVVDVLGIIEVRVLIT